MQSIYQYIPPLLQSSNRRRELPTGLEGPSHHDQPAFPHPLREYHNGQFSTWISSPSIYCQGTLLPSLYIWGRCQTSTTLQYQIIQLHDRLKPYNTEKIENSGYLNLLPHLFLLRLRHCPPVSIYKWCHEPISCHSAQETRKLRCLNANRLPQLIGGDTYP